MDRLIYVAMTGARHSMQALSTIGHNLANASTTGFRSQLQAFGARPVPGGGHQSRVNAVAEFLGFDDRTGAIAPTGRDLDVAIRGSGWLAVQTASGGEAYTRAGDLRIGGSGMLETGRGNLVMGEAGPISIPQYQQLFIGDEGQISIVPAGQKASTLVEIGRLKLVDPELDQLRKGQDGLFHMRDGKKAKAVATVALSTGHLESSNVNAAEALVEMIQLSRQYEMQMQAIRKTAENEESSTSLMRLGG